MPGRRINGSGRPRTVKQRRSGTSKRRPLIRRIKFFRLFLVLIVLSGMVYGAYVTLSAAYDWLYVKVQENSSHKSVIAPQFDDAKYDNYTNILIIGIDEQPVGSDNKSGRYADAVMLLSLDHSSKEVRFLSLPRNIKLDIPGRREPDYLSYTYYYGGSLLTVDSVAQLLQVPITQYIALDRNALSQLIDALGGINIYVEDDMNYDDPASGTSIHLPQGYQYMTGDMAQQYLRYRSDDLGDIGRVQRQQKFVKALFDKMMTVETLPSLPSIIHIFNNSMDTNIDLLGISSFVEIIDTLKTSEVQVKMLPGNLSPDGDWIPDKSRIEQDMNEMFK